MSVFLFLACKKDNKIVDKTSIVDYSTIFPHTDVKNADGWVYNQNLSDEFNDKTINAAKWLIQGTNNEYRSNFKGRAPSQFSTKNATLDDGKLTIAVKWEPDFAFSTIPDNTGVKYENYTTAAVIGKNEFTYGYMEIRCKAADASVSSAFWALGNNTELDVFEHFGKPSQRQKIQLETEMWSSIHDWSVAGGPTVWTTRSQIPFRVAGDFHVYACEWDKDYLKFYADGKLIKFATREEVGAGWILTKPIKIWMSSVTWTWHGLPIQTDLPAKFEIDYVRVWQKK